jgi:hypothetical protein
MAYAAGKLAWGACDRCGQRFLLNELKKEWQNLKVCTFCYEPKQPQLEPRRNVSDAIALYEPRPLPDDTFNVFLGLIGGSAFGSNGMLPVPVSRPTIAVTYAGNLQVSTS